MAKSPAVILFDSNGQAMAVEDGVAIPAGTQALLAAGSDGTDAKILLVDATGRQVVVGAGTAGTPDGGVVTIQGAVSGTPIPVSGSLSLPDGAATEATVETLLADATFTARINTQGQKAMSASTPVVLASDQSAVTVTGSVGVSNLPVTQAISAAALPLPSGAATETTLAARATETTLSALNTKLQSGTIKTDGSATTQPVSGTVAVSNLPVTQPISAATLPLPTGAATSAKQPALGTAGTPATDVLTVQGAVSMTALKVDGSASTQPVSGSVSVSNFPGTQSVSGSVSVSNFPATQAVSAAALPLPTGAATETTLASLNTKTPTVGQKTSAASSPVVLATDQSSIPVAATISGTPSVSVTNFPATQPVSATTLPLPTGAATSANQTTGNSSLSSIDGKTPALGQAAMVASIPVVIANNQSAVSISGTVSVSNFPGTQPVSAASLPLPTGAATEASLAALNAKIPAQGQAIKAASLPVTLASDEGAVAISAASLPLPSGAATAANQPAFGIAGTPSSDVLTVQGSALMTALKVDGSGSTQPITNIDSVVSGTISAVGQSVTTGDLNGQGSGTFVLTGVWVGTVQFEGSVDGTNYVSVGCRAVNVSGIITFIGSNGTWRFSCSAFKTFRIRASAFTSGSVSVVIRTSSAATALTLSEALPTGANTIGSVSQAGTWLNRVTDGTNTAAVKTGSAPAVVTDPALVVAVSPNNTVAVSAAALPLPSGAATSAKQPALGVAGTASADVLTIQGIASMTALKVDGSAVTQPISGAITANIGTTGALALDTTLTNGTQISVLRGGAKGSTPAADVTSLAAGANHQALVVAVVDASGNQFTSFGKISTTSSVTSVAGSATSVQLLAANTAREGATIYNDSTAVLYVKLGTTASNTSFTVKMLANGYYEVPFGYNGRIDGIWAFANGNARITELS